MPQANSFCTAPWNSMVFWQNSKVSPCHIWRRDYRNTAKTASEMINSSWYKELRQELLDNKKPMGCSACWRKESEGLNSIRMLTSNYWPEYNDPNLYKVDDPPTIKTLEIRESNLCNFQCRMCSPDDSSAFGREVKDNPELQKFGYKPHELMHASEENWNDIVKISETVRMLVLTGGEPLLIKKYHDLLEHLIKIGKTDMELRIYTNCSVYNPNFMEQFKKFDKPYLYLSIDATGKVAEYQRYGTKWDVVRNNVFRFLEYPIGICVQSTVTAYSILDMSNLADFFLEILNRKPDATFSAHISLMPIRMNYINLNDDLRKRAIEQIDLAVNKLNSPIFHKVTPQLISMKDQYLKGTRGDFDSFVEITKAMDRSRGQSFEEVYGYKI